MDVLSPTRGTLYVVSTPIGNLEDISVRALENLRSVDLIAAEDTRTTKVLLDRYGIRKSMVSYFGYNEARRIPQLLARLKEGSSIALVSEAGTPGISDPASGILRAALREDLPVEAIPGPSALLAGLVVSALPIQRFVFEGFPPTKKGRSTFFTELRSVKHTIVLYESPHRLLRTLTDLRDSLGDRRVAVARELTKKFEEIIRCSLTSAIAHFLKIPPRGEFVLIIGPPGPQS